MTKINDKIQNLSPMQQRESREIQPSSALRKVSFKNGEELENQKNRSLTPRMNTFRGAERD